ARAAACGGPRAWCGACVRRASRWCPRSSAPLACEGLTHANGIAGRNHERDRLTRRDQQHYGRTEVKHAELAATRELGWILALDAQPAGGAVVRDPRVVEAQAEAADADRADEHGRDAAVRRAALMHGHALVAHEQLLHVAHANRVDGKQRARNVTNGGHRPSDR